jgi:dTDP-4-dehydrorhamnose 3,5-epimerase-like enzyme
MVAMTPEYQTFQVDISNNQKKAQVFILTKFMHGYDVGYNAYYLVQEEADYNDYNN